MLASRPHHTCSDDACGEPIGHRGVRTCRVVRAHRSDYRLSGLSPHADHHMLPAEVPVGAASPRTGRTPGPASHPCHMHFATSPPPPQPSGRHRRLHAAGTPPPPSAGRHSRGRDLVATVLESVARRVLAGTGRVRLRLSEESRRGRLELTRVAGTRGQGAVGGEGG